MLDYYGSILKQKTEIYSEILSYFYDYNQSYIKLKLDALYDCNYINDEVSISGWMIFIRPEIIKKINESICKDLQSSRYKLLLTRIMHNNKHCNHDIMELISSYIY